MSISCVPPLRRHRLSSVSAWASRPPAFARREWPCLAQCAVLAYRSWLVAHANIDRPPIVSPLSCRQLFVNFRDWELRPEQFEQYPVLILVHETKDMAAAFAEPIMLYAVDSNW